ncbi:MAG: universal stress protein [Desulfarculaceae bacterium]|nr:universal stress protein [Desulfarculaceae bacterium]MCF8071162.1 universal stress protein [Desulfarculaceae bacterium]MCF8101235.1 universal stress protein [Desulfarculaceae bacterium]MCF8115216.1 universal stress protein [Desulfarculaceae bacterium]
MAAVKVLLAVDFSDYSGDSAGVAGELARCLGAELVALNVLHQRTVDELKFIQATTELVQSDQAVAQRTASRRERLETLLHQQGLEAKVLVGVGVPWEVILDTAEREQVAYIVMGTKGRGDFARTLLGSNADKVYRHSPVTVVSVRGDQHRGHLARVRGAGA